LRFNTNGQKRTFWGEFDINKKTLLRLHTNETVKTYYLRVPYFLWPNKSKDVETEKIRSWGGKKIRVDSIEQPPMSREDISRVFDTSISFHHRHSQITNQSDEAYDKSVGTSCEFPFRPFHHVRTWQQNWKC
jgi:hypothetical protein